MEYADPVTGRPRAYHSFNYVKDGSNLIEIDALINNLCSNRPS